MTSEKPEFETETIHPELVHVPFSTLPETKVETNNKEDSDRSSWSELVDHIKNNREEKTNPGNLEFPREHPPEYLNVQGWKDCLEEKQLGSHSVVCLPSEQPDNCLQNSWLELIRIWTSEKEFEKCDETEEKIEIPGNSEFRKGYPPEYLNVPGWKDCLGEKNLESHSVVCLPSEKPENCLQSSWDELKRIWTSEKEFEKCDESEEKLSFGNSWPPDFMNVPGWQDCITVFGSYICLSNKVGKPDNCLQSSWDELSKFADSTEASEVFGHKLEWCDQFGSDNEPKGQSYSERLPEKPNEKTERLPEKPNEKTEIPQIIIDKNQQVQLEGSTNYVYFLKFFNFTEKILKLLFSLF